MPIGEQTNRFIDMKPVEMGAKVLPIWRTPEPVLDLQEVANWYPSVVLPREQGLRRFLYLGMFRPGAIPHAGDVPAIFDAWPPLVASCIWVPIVVWRVVRWREEVESVAHLPVRWLGWTALYSFVLNVRVNLARPWLVPSGLIYPTPKRTVDTGVVVVVADPHLLRGITRQGTVGCCSKPRVVMIGEIHHHSHAQLLLVAQAHGLLSRFFGSYEYRKQNG